MAPIQHLNPETLHRNPAFSQAIQITGPHRTIYVGGQNAVDAGGTIVGSGDIGAQALRVAENIELVLEAADARVSDLVKLTVYVVDGQPVMPAFGAFQERWGAFENPPTISVVTVAGLAHPEFLLEVEGVAVVAE